MWQPYFFFLDESHFANHILWMSHSFFQPCFFFSMTHSFEITFFLPSQGADNGDLSAESPRGAGCGQSLPERVMGCVFGVIREQRGGRH